MISLDRYSTKENREVKTKWMRFQESGLLIETDDNQLILYDTGSNDYDLDRSARFPYFRNKDQGVVSQLEKLSIKPEEIDFLILSHLHDDHCGNIDLFSNAKIMIDKDEYDYVKEKKKNGKALFGAYKIFDPQKEYDVELIGRDVDFNEKIRIIRLPGHSSGLLGMLIRLEYHNPLLIVSDASNTEMNFNRSIVAVGNINNAKYLESLDKIRELQKKENAFVVFGHDEEQFSKIKKCPLYYE